MRSYSPWKIYGGKGNISGWILSHIAQDRITAWIEPFLGGAHVYAHLDHYQDFDPDIVLLAEADPMLWLVHLGAVNRPGYVMDAVAWLLEEARWRPMTEQSDRELYFSLRDEMADMWMTQIKARAVDHIPIHIAVQRLWVLSRHGFGGYQGAKKTGSIHPKWGTWAESDKQGLASLGWYLAAMHAQKNRLEIMRDYELVCDAIIDNPIKAPRTGGIVAYLDPPYSADTRSTAGGRYVGEELGRWAIASGSSAVSVIARTLPPGARIMISHYPHQELDQAIATMAALTDRVVDVHARKATTIGSTTTEVLWDVHRPDDETVVDTGDVVDLRSGDTVQTELGVE